MLGSVPVDYELGLDGHSDADAVLHAITDAILGAIGQGDIGEHFDPGDPQWADADSETFVRAALGMAAERGLAVVNCDVTVVAEQPNLKAYKPTMRDRIATMLGVATENVAVKAKTNEGMGPIGRGEGIAAMAIVMMSSCDAADGPA